MTDDRRRIRRRAIDQRYAQRVADRVATAAVNSDPVAVQRLVGAALLGLPGVAAGMHPDDRLTAAVELTRRGVSVNRVANACGLSFLTASKIADAIHGHEGRVPK